MGKFNGCLTACGAVLGYSCVALAYFFMGYADYAVISWMIMPTFQTSFWKLFHIISFNLLLGLTFLTHFRAMTCNPGIVPISKRQNNDKSNPSDGNQEIDLNPALKPYIGRGWTFCTRCETRRPPRAHHCRICQRCVRKMDHHCPWINNCVGEFNQKYFLQFLIYVGLLSIYAGALTLFSWSQYDENEPTTTTEQVGELARHSRLIHTVLLSTICAIFGIFVVAIMFNQLYAIFRDETMVESVQRRGSIRRRPEFNKRQLLARVCGPNIHWSLWMLPCISLPAKYDVVRFAKIPEDFNV